MSDILIHKSREVGYNEFGQTVKSDEAHVKILVSFKRGALRMMKGARLHVFICIMLHEAEDNPGASLSTIHDETGYDRTTIMDALAFLEDPSHRFIDRDGKMPDGTHIYRPAAYAWFGSDKHKRSPIPQGLPPSKSPSMPGGRKIRPPRGENPSSSSVHLSSNMRDKSTSTPETAAQEILHEAGWFSITRDLPQFSDEEHARALARTIHDNPMCAQDPASYVRSCVMLNQNWGKPPERQIGFAPLRRSDFNDAQWRRMLPANRQQIIADETGNPDAVDDPMYGCDQLVA